jgi:WD40 repeat protein
MNVLQFANHLTIALWLSVTAALAAAGCDSAGGPAAGDGVKRLERFATPLPENPPIRFKKLSTLKGEGQGFSFGYLEFSPDGKVLAVVRSRDYHEAEVSLWDVEKRRRIHVLAGPQSSPERVYALSFVPPGDRLVTAGSGYNKAFLWDVRTGKLLNTPDPGGTPPKSGVMGVAAFPDGKRVISCSASGSVVWDLQTDTQTNLPLDDYVPPFPEEVRAPGFKCCHSVAFSADGSQFATTLRNVAADKRLLIWDAKTCRVTTIITVNGYVGDRLAFAPDGSTVATFFVPWQSKAVVGVWDATSGKQLLAGQAIFDFGLIDLAYTRDGKYLLATGDVQGGTIQEGPYAGLLETAVGVWDVATGKIVNKISPAGSLLTHIAISPDNKLLAVPARNDIDIYAIEYAEQPKGK